MRTLRSGRASARLPLAAAGIRGLSERQPTARAGARRRSFGGGSAGNPIRAWRGLCACPQWRGGVLHGRGATLELSLARVDLEANLAVNNGDDVAADPDVVAVLAQVNAPGALQRRALSSDVRRFGEPGTDQPLREARVEAAGDRILVTAAADERTHLKGGVMTRFVRTDHAQLERIQ